MKELNILGSCHHKNVLPYLGAYAKDDRVRAVLGYCVGSCVNLFQRLKRCVHGGGGLSLPSRLPSFFSPRDRDRVRLRVL
jgi:hypothetical protein